MLKDKLRRQMEKTKAFVSQRAMLGISGVEETAERTAHEAAKEELQISQKFSGCRKRSRVYDIAIS